MDADWLNKWSLRPTFLLPQVVAQPRHGHPRFLNQEARSLRLAAQGSHGTAPGPGLTADQTDALSGSRRFARTCDMFFENTT